jgi:3-hydroxybutyryl-CoA dehydrogenase
VTPDVPVPDADATVAVVGPGRMGRGIATVFAGAGHEVTVLDAKDRPPGETGERFEALRTAVRSNLGLLAEAGRFEGDVGDAVDLVGTTTDRGALAEADWVFEALPEDPDVKTGFLSAAADHVPEDGVVATTTSSISLDTLAPAVPDRSRLVITHWLNPAFVVPLVEVARAEYTDDDAVAATVDLLDRVDKEPVVCRDSPGFVGSRVQAAAMNEAVRAYEDGVADLADIDTALRTGVGFRMAAMGLLEFLDLGGVDILYYVNEYLGEELGDRFENPDSVVEKVEADDLGPKTGRGYYDYEGVDAEALRVEKYRVMIALREALEAAAEDGPVGPSGREPDRSRDDVG